MLLDGMVQLFLNSGKLLDKLTENYYLGSCNPERHNSQ